MSERLRKLLEQRATAWSQAEEIHNRFVSENREPTAEESEAWDRALADVERLSKEIEVEERHARLSSLSPVTEADVRSLAPRAGDSEDRTSEYEKVFGSFLRRGATRLSAAEQEILATGFDSELRAQGAGVPAAGGYTVPEGFWAKVTEVIKAYGGLMARAQVLTTTSGNDIPWPTVDDTGNEGAILDENTQVGEQDVAFGQNKLGAYTYTSKLVRVALQLLQDSGVDVEGLLARLLGARIGRALAGHIATGNGVGQPKGIVNVAAGATGAVSATAKITYDDLIDLEHSVDPALRDNGIYGMNDLTVALIRKLKDQQNRPLWVPSMAGGVPSTINGRPYFVDNKLPAPAPDAKSVFFGDFNAALVVRQVSGGQLMRLAERYADYLQVGFLAFGRFDATLDNTAAVKAFKHGAAA